MCNVNGSEYDIVQGKSVTSSTDQPRAQKMEGDRKEKLLKTVEEEEGEEEKLSLWKRVWKESKKMWIVAGPAIFNRISTFGIYIISQAFVGHIGSKELAGFAIVYTVFIRFANGILLGMASALATLCGQAYGAKELSMMGVYLQRSWIVSFLTALFILPLFIFTTPILRILGQDESIAQEAGIISLWSIPVMFSLFVSFTCQQFLQSQSKNIIIAFLAAFSLTIHVILSWLLTIQYKFGIVGALTSTSLAFWIPNIGNLIFITCGWCPDTWKGFSCLAFKDLWPVFKLSISAGAMLALELWYNTILVLLTGNMENAEVQIDALSICLNINGWELMISFGFLAAASVRVANELGKGSSKSAKFSVAVSVLTSLTIGFILFLFFLFFRERLAYIFTKNKDVVNAVGDLSPLLAVSILLNSVQPVLSGVAVGAGWQSTVALVNLGCYYIIGLPVGIVLGNVFHWQVKGIWVGMLFGVAIQTIVLLIICYKTDWDEQVLKARNRVNRWSKVEPDHNKSDN
ncbi:protein DETOXIFICATION 21-like isoform X2 [Lotus japonicus]|uniref:protein DETOXIFICATION 21-like isoform X2 n=1 Tax=Lotus japonicus TaxID=34305 RepID=UPI00258C63A8|nr:protein DETOXIFICATION 21-like isoform X2 [Lotus japonicus]